MQNTTSSWPHISSYTDPVDMDHPMYHRPPAAALSQPPYPPRCGRPSRQSPAEPSSQPPSPRRRRSSTPEPPNLISSIDKDVEFHIYMEHNNKIIAEFNERRKDFVVEHHWAKGEDYKREVLIMKSIGRFGLRELTKLGHWLANDDLVKRWMEVKFGEKAAKEQATGEKLTIEWKKFIEMLVMENKYIRDMMTPVLLNRLKDGSFEMQKFHEHNKKWRLNIF